MAWPDRLRLPLQFQPDALLRDLRRLSDRAWIAHFVTQNYEGDWSALPLRSAAGAIHPIMTIYADSTATTFVDTPLLDACPYFREVIGAFACEVQSVRLMRLTPGSIIKAHRDHDLAAEDGRARVHIPVVTNPGVRFRLNDTPVPMQPGEAWYLRLSDLHSVTNQGDADRVHLVIDIIVNGWFSDLLELAISGVVAAPSPARMGA